MTGVGQDDRQPTRGALGNQHVDWQACVWRGGDEQLAAHEVAAVDLLDQFRRRVDVRAVEKADG